MSDRSFGDHAFRNVVKNPLLSTSVTGLSIEDLTHNAVLLPAVPSQEMSTRRDERPGSQQRSLRQSDHDIANLPSGDTNSNIHPPNPLTSINLSTTNNQNTLQNVGSNELSTSNVSKASAKSDDDFDVNEYFARLQGTRYVSAPLNSVLKEDQNANLEASEENLEEINLNEPEKGGNQDSVQQSITADIAQNFSQLPTVLPQMASVVFNSFSNMLSMKSREQTPEESRSLYQDSNFRPAEPSAPVGGMPDVVKDIAPPPAPQLKEPPIVGTANYRITTRKKVYAQVPGLTSGETVQNMLTYNQPPVSQSTPYSYFLPDAKPPTPVLDVNPGADRKEFDNRTAVVNDLSGGEASGNVTEVKSSSYDIFTPTQANTDAVRKAEVNIVETEAKSQAYDMQSEQVNPLPSQFAITSQSATQTLVQDAFVAPPMNTSHGLGTSIPPPPVSMSKRDSQASVGRSILPPSVARRISANQPVIKNQPLAKPQYSNIFVPQSTSDAASSSEGPSGVINTEPLPAAPPTVPNTNLDAISSISFTSGYLPPSSAHIASNIFVPTDVNAATSYPSGVNQTAPEHSASNVLSSIPSGLLPPSTSLSHREQIGVPPICTPPMKSSIQPLAERVKAEERETVIGTSQAAEEKPTIANTSNVAQSFFSPSTSFNMSQEAMSAHNASVGQMNISTPPMFFNPASGAQTQSDNSIFGHTNIETPQQNMSQFFNPNEVPPVQKMSVPEPPKAQGTTNYRMTKKRPQYYSGPIEGVGSISNNIKPAFTPEQSTSFHGSLFTPQDSMQSLTQSEPSYGANTGAGQIPFDNFTMPPVTSHNFVSAPMSLSQEPTYNTAFDFSRPTTDRFEPPQAESSGFGLIGSIKSKLSSIDIGKIQNTVTTFFDPAYNDVKTEQPNTNDYQSYSNYPASSSTQQFSNQAACIDMMIVPGVQPSPQQHSYNFNYQAESQSPYTTSDYHPQPRNQQGDIENVFQPSTQCFYEFREQNQATSTMQQDVHNISYGATVQSTYSPSEQNPAEGISHQTIHDNNYLTTFQRPSSDDHNRLEEISQENNTSNSQTADNSPSGNNDNNQGNLVPQQTIDNVNYQATTQISNDNNEKAQLESIPKVDTQNVGNATINPSEIDNPDTQIQFTPEFVEQITDDDRERIAKVIANFNEEKNRNFNAQTAFEALANALDPNYVPEDVKPETPELPKGPGIMFSMPGISKDGEIDYVPSNPRLITDEPLTDEQHKKAYHDFLKRSADIFDGDESHVIEPDSRPSSPCEKSRKSPQKNPVPSNSTIDYGYNSDFISQYLTDSTTAPEQSNTLKYDSSSDNTGSDSLRFFIPYKATAKELEMIAKLGDISLESGEANSNDTSLLLDKEDKYSCNVTKTESDEKEINDVTKQMIENITAPIQLSNPVEVPLTESNVIIDDNPEFSSNQFAEISHITEETIETIQVQSATELLQDANVDDTVYRNYVWLTDNAALPSHTHNDHPYTIPDPNAIGFLQNTSMFFDNVLTNASDELKVECKHSLDDQIVLPRQMSVPSAPPAEDSKSDEGVLDVQSIEQDAKKDFMFIDEMIIEPETDDGKMKERERTSDDHAQEIDSFTNRVEKYKKLEETSGEEKEERDQVTDKPVNKPYPSYFDTGNFAADNHFKNSPHSSFMSYGQNIPMRIPPGFEQEYYKKCNLTSHCQSQPEQIEREEIPDATTQTATVASTHSNDSDKADSSSDKINAMVEEFLKQKNEIKPRRLKIKRPDYTPLAHTLGTSAEEMMELYGYHIRHSPTPEHPPEPFSTAEDIMRQYILPHLRHSPLRRPANNQVNENEADAARNRNVASGHVPSTSNVVNTPSIANEHPDVLHASQSEEARVVNPLVTDQLSSSILFPSTNSQETEERSTTSTEKDNPVNNVVLPERTEIFSSVSDHRDDITQRSLETRSDNSSAIFQESTSSLTDPLNFFSSAPSSSATISNTTADEEEQSFSRLSSYFTSPPTTKTDHSKSFFELSQSQDHYRQNQPNQPATQVLPQNVSRFFDSAASNQLLQAASNNETLVNAAPNIPQYNNSANMNLIRELTSVRNFVPQNVVTTANYFTVHYDYDSIKNLSVGEPGCVSLIDNCMPTTSNKNETDFKHTESKKLGELGENDSNNETAIVNNCKYCCDMNSGRILKLDIDNVDFNDKIKRAMDSNTDTNKNDCNTMEESKPSKKKIGHSVNFDTSSLQEEPNEAACMMSENRSSSEYTPVKFHWFYRVDVEGKSVWRGFSMTDSRALEKAFNSPDLNEDTVVATDGGRFDVNVMSRLRTAVYWADKPTDVKRCSWFYKGTTDARYVPYSEEVAEKLEEEYRHGVTTGEWHRRLMLANGEVVVMHGPAVMVHLLQTASDAVNSSPLFSFGKRVYRNPPKIRLSQDYCDRIDHLLLLVHGAGEFSHQKEKILAWDANNQSMGRPRVVRRGCVEAEIEECEPSSVDHLLLLCHGVGSACDMRFRPVEEVVDDFRTTSLQLLQSHYRNSYDNGLVGRIEVLPISWHASLHSHETGVDGRLAAVTLDSIPKLRSFTNDTILDVLFYTSPVYCQHIIDTVCGELNRIYRLFKRRNPRFEGGVSLGGHSLGSVILYDLLCHQVAEEAASSPEVTSRGEVVGRAGTGQPSVSYPTLEFEPDALYALGSPIAIFECIRGVVTLGKDFKLPTCKNFFNIFHPYDPIAYRIEPMINPDLRDVKPHLIPHHKGRKRMHLELKDTMARVGADIKAKIIESIRSTWSSVWKTQPPPDQHLEKVVEEEMEKEESYEESKEEVTENSLTTADMLGKLNNGRRIDYVLQEAPFEMINEYLFAMRSHVCYWESEDTMLLILREVYDALGIQPDSSVPQQTLTVHRTRTVHGDEIVDVTEDSPSTSRGGS